MRKLETFHPDLTATFKRKFLGGGGAVTGGASSPTSYCPAAAAEAAGIKTALFMDEERTSRAVKRGRRSSICSSNTTSSDGTTTTTASNTTGSPEEEEEEKARLWSEAEQRFQHVYEHSTKYSLCHFLQVKKINSLRKKNSTLNRNSKNGDDKNEDDDTFKQWECYKQNRRRLSIRSRITSFDEFLRSTECAVAVHLFNGHSDASTCLTYLRRHWLLERPHAPTQSSLSSSSLSSSEQDAETEMIAKFLTHAPNLNKLRIQQYLAAPEHLPVLRKFCDQMNFAGKDPIQCLQAYQEFAPISGEWTPMSMIFPQLGRAYSEQNSKHCQSALMRLNPEEWITFYQGVLMLNKNLYGSSSLTASSDGGSDASLAPASLRFTQKQWAEAMCEALEEQGLPVAMFLQFYEQIKQIKGGLQPCRDHNQEKLVELDKLFGLSADDSLPALHRLWIATWNVRVGFLPDPVDPDAASAQHTLTKRNNYKRRSLRNRNSLNAHMPHHQGYQLHLFNDMLVLTKRQLLVTASSSSQYKEKWRLPLQSVCLMIGQSACSSELDETTLQIFRDNVQLMVSLTAATSVSSSEDKHEPHVTSNQPANSPSATLHDIMKAIDSAKLIESEAIQFRNNFQLTHSN